LGESEEAAHLHEEPDEGVEEARWVLGLRGVVVGAKGMPRGEFAVAANIYTKAGKY
jgi:hypothetical protein